MLNLSRRASVAFHLLLNTGIAAFFCCRAQSAEVRHGPAAHNAQGSTAVLACDDRLQAAFKPDANTELRLVHQFRKGDSLSLDGTPTGMTALADLCLVKLNIGPGNPGPAGAPSTSRGIGVEIWLPSWSPSSSSFLVMCATVVMWFGVTSTTKPVVSQKDPVSIFGIFLIGSHSHPR